ncbi:hypothetical protein LPJ66_011674, partial [Kickxella alabastrina]
MRDIISGRWLLTSQQGLSPGVVYLNVQIVEFGFDYAGTKDGVKSEHVRLQFAKLVEFTRRMAPNAKHMHLHNFGDDRLGLADMSVPLDVLGRKVSDGLKGIERVGFRSKDTDIPSTLVSGNNAYLAYVCLRNLGFRLVQYNVLTLEDVAIYLIKEFGLAGMVVDARGNLLSYPCLRRLHIERYPEAGPLPAFPNGIAFPNHHHLRIEACSRIASQVLSAANVNTLGRVGIRLNLIVLDALKR